MRVAAFSVAYLLAARILCAQPAAPLCHVSGDAASAGTPLPGVAIVATSESGDTHATSTDLNGRFDVELVAGTTYHLKADLPMFASVSKDVPTASANCNVSLHLEMTLAGSRRPVERSTPAQARRFQTLSVSPDENAAASNEAAISPVDVSQLLPPGFSPEIAGAQPMTVSGSSSATTVDRGAMNERMFAIGRGLIDPISGLTSPGEGLPPDAGFGGRGPLGGPGGPGAFFGGPAAGIGGFGGGPFGRRQNGYQGAVTYGFGGSALDTAPYQLRPDVPVTQPAFTRNSFGITLGGPLKIPGLYADQNRRSSFQANYQGTRADNVFDRYATVPTAAERSGDFSASAASLIDPQTGLPFPDNRIPADRLDPAAVALLASIPMPNLSGTSQNLHTASVARTTSDNLSIRFTQNLSPQAAAPGQRGPGPGGGRFGGGAFGGGPFNGPGGQRPGGRAGSAQRRTTIMFNGQLQVRRNTTDVPNVFSTLSGTTRSTTVTAPLSLNIVHGRTIHNATVNVTHSSSSSTTPFANAQDIAGDAGILYPSNADISPANWGFPNLSFTSISDARLPAASRRSDTRVSFGYFFSRGIARHQLRAGADARLDSTTSDSTANARGTYTFTGIYTSAGYPIPGSGADVADFLLGLPQQAALQVGAPSHLRGRSFDAYLDDNWRPTAKLTVNLGARYELVLPYTEENGQLANLDVAPGFTAASSVVAGGIGPYTGPFPAALIDADTNNIGPRIGVAYRLAQKTVLRGGYSVTYNNGSYASLARQLAAQPPFAQTETVSGTLVDPLLLETALLASGPSAITNNWGVDRNYQLGNIQAWNVTLSRDLSQNVNLTAGYTGTKGTSLDILRAPNRGPLGLRIDNVQPFIWESSGGHSHLDSAIVQIRRRLASGFMTSVSYTLSKSMDNASSLGAGAPVVAQDDQNLGAEWALSNFDRRHQLTGQLFWEIPFGATHRWLSDGGPLATMFGNWSVSSTVSYQSGTPFTARVLGAVNDVSRGTNGSLRADYNGAAIALTDPTVAEFFNTAAFSAPAPGAFGTAARNTIIGPSAFQVNGSLSRDLVTSGRRSLTLSVNALNLFNNVQWATIDTNLNSPTFGQVLTVRAMRTITVNLRARF